ncbi:hypothetical protein ACH4E7_04155 [Kitasatospora sp. NPDC018058]|uniref:hypothetical protein n=1 Tax=Kitasatospora sp. NPDC018058 TaxID=3364025 RepID=UPI0037BEA9FD
MGQIAAGHTCAIKTASGGLISADWCIEHFAPVLVGLPDLAEADPARPELLIHEETVRSKHVQIYYTPFDRSIDPGAKVILVGVTPGRQQFRLAVQAARAALVEGCSPEEAVRRADETASFAGPMRKNAVTMLDAIGLADALGITTTSTLFDEHAGLCATTSAVCHAMFVDGETKSGDEIAKTPIFRAFATQVLGAELRGVPDALVIPFGKTAAEAVRLNIESGDVSAERCLVGFPSPAGGNGHRKRLFELEQDRLVAAVKAWAAR